MTEPGDPTLSLEVVRARIFYLASDVEPVSPPAAMLLRAVADAIDVGDNPENVSEPQLLNGELTRLLSKVNGTRPLGSHATDAAPSSERRLGVVGSQSGYKR